MDLRLNLFSLFLAFALVIPGSLTFADEGDFCPEVEKIQNFVLDKITDPESRDLLAIRLGALGSGLLTATQIVGLKRETTLLLQAQAELRAVQESKEKLHAEFGKKIAKEISEAESKYLTGFRSYKSVFESRGKNFAALHDDAVKFARAEVTHRAVLAGEAISPSSLKQLKQTRNYYLFRASGRLALGTLAAAAVVNLAPLLTSGGGTTERTKLLSDPKLFLMTAMLSPQSFCYELHSKDSAKAPALTERILGREKAAIENGVSTRREVQSDLTTKPSRLLPENLVESDRPSPAKGPRMKNLDSVSTSGK